MRYPARRVFLLEKGTDFLLTDTVLSQVKNRLDQTSLGMNFAKMCLPV